MTMSSFATRGGPRLMPCGWMRRVTRIAVAGIAIWDCYNYAKLYHEDWHSLNDDEIVELWDEIDFIHADLYRSLKSLAMEYAVEGAPEAPTKQLTPVRTRSSGRPKSRITKQKGTGKPLASRVSSSGRGRGRRNR